MNCPQRVAISGDLVASAIAPSGLLEITPDLRSCSYSDFTAAEVVRR